MKKRKVIEFDEYGLLWLSQHRIKFERHPYHGPCLFGSNTVYSSWLMGKDGKGIHPNLGYFKTRRGRGPKWLKES